eukprot:SM000164S02267  [mRNA]  locus=s164:320074:320786:+ [translate_table: standard]
MCRAAAASPNTELRAGSELQDEELALSGGGSAQRVYALAGVAAGRSYEVKISYPGFLGVVFSIRMLAAEKQPPPIADNRAGAVGRRRLLDTEKLVFRAPSPAITADPASPAVAHEPTVTQPRVEVSAAFVGVVSPGRLAPTTIRYNIGEMATAVAETTETM